MQGQGDGSQHTDEAGRRGHLQGCAQDGIVLGMLIGVAYFSISPFASLLSPHQSTPQRLAYAGVAYAGAIVAAMLLRVLYKLPGGILRLFLFSLAFAILLGPTLFGSVCIVAALIQLAGGYVDAWGVVLLGLFLYAAVFLVIYSAVAGFRVHG